ncbi:MAG: TPM domain-containing protein [Rhodocyclaceae bacterium]|nr:TPM domain-containing protein [Rhodocyclaceae bacterium]
MSSPVVDRAALLSDAAESRLRDTLRMVQRRHGSEIVVLTLPSTKPESFEAFSLRVANTWRPGRAGIDDGLLIVVARDDRAARIEVGRGLEAVITDADAMKIIDGEMTPAFREGDFALGIERAVQAVAARLSGEPLPVAAHRADRHSGSDLFFAMALVAGVFGGRLLRGPAGRVLSAVLIGLAVGMGAWRWTDSVGVSILAGLGAAALALTIEPAQAELPHRGRRSRTPDWDDEPDAHRWNDGGDFGGGGASGRW